MRTGDAGVRCGEREGFVEIVLARPERRNALSREVLAALREAFEAAGRSGRPGVLLRAEGPVFSAGHDFRDLAGADLPALRALLELCTDVMRTIRRIPQVVVAAVQGLATAAGCQLVATCDLAVASTEARFQTPGGRGGWFCTTPMVALTRAVPPKAAFEMLFTGDPIDAETALRLGLVNRVVPPQELEAAALELLRRATRGSPLARAIGKRAFYAQLPLDEERAYAYAVEVMAATGTTEDAQEQFRAFLERRPPVFRGR